MTPEAYSSQSWQDAHIVPSSETPLYEQVFGWLTSKGMLERLSKPARKALARMVSGMVATSKATIGDVSTAIRSLGISAAKEESIAHGVRQWLGDARLDPSLLRDVYRHTLAELLAERIKAHEANDAAGGGQEEWFAGIQVVLDESSQEDKVHLVVAGIPVGGVVLPLAVRTWEQNVPMAEGEYWAQIGEVLQEVQAMIPACLRDHVVLTADRGYGSPRMLDILKGLGWQWLLRIQGQTRVRLRDGECCSVRSLVAKPGDCWSSGFDGETGREATESEPVGVFKAAGWRCSQVVAVWPQEQEEPWLLVTSLPGRLERVEQYARRWAIERLFLGWKSHGWDIEASGIHEPHRLGRWLTVLSLATLWRLAMATPVALQQLADLAGRTGRAARQPRLPGLSTPSRPWAAKHSLLTWGAKAARTTLLRLRTPALCWCLPFLDQHTWADTCRHVYTAVYG